MSPGDKKPKSVVRRMFASAGWREIAFLALAVLAVRLLGDLGYRFNTSESIPRGIYSFRTGSIERGAFVAVCLPPALSKTGIERGYLVPGECFGGARPVLKRALGLPGDLVTVAETVAINGVEIPDSRRAALDSRGRWLDRVPIGEYALGTSELWLGSLHEKGWDSRYWGPIRQEATLAIAVPEWLWDQPE
ncbi:MAG: conjugative transfer signal peptidase TraF [Thermoanaerobaculia bacterium]|nr:conjugative transfer signal peptidase TraF [Thermoanaerobaculia bacterium]